ncbi:hypothetical protein, partial [Photobacterium halotolerans]|uniref:hypothetical protein n=1 Tax=Photobacterium halotolerans TaxID=265726 RepID=UPI001F2DA8CB
DQISPMASDKPALSTIPGKNSGRIFRLSAPGAPTTTPATTSEPKGISGYALCQQRVTGAHPAVLRKTPNSSATYDQQKLMFF